MITPFLIKLDEIDKYKEEESSVEPIIVHLPIDQLKIKGEET